MVLCAAFLMAAPALAAQDLLEREALREALRLEPRASSGGPIPVPLPERSERSASASAARELASIARSRHPERVLVGVSRHADLPGLTRALERLGARPEPFATFGVIAADAPSGAALARALRGDPRVAYVEREGELRLATDPLDVPDPEHANLKYTWFYDDVRAADALAAAGGGSRRTIAVMDTGLDLSHPEFAGRVARSFDTFSGGSTVTDTVGHGTFVTGLIVAIDGNGIGGKGVAGRTRVLAIRGSRDGGFGERALLRGIDFALRHGADVLNMSLAGDGINRSVVRALGAAFYNDVLPVAASGNLGLDGNPVQFPAAVLGGRRGAPGIGLSVAATKPNGTVAPFSTHNEYVSLAAPGAGALGCEFGVLSTLPAAGGTEWDVPESCSRLVPNGGVRFAYGEGTSFSAPIVSGIAALTWQVERRLASEQVAEVLQRSARQTRGTGWNRFTGTGIVDGKAATDLARTYDVTPPRVRGTVWRDGSRAVTARVKRTRDRTESGRELAGSISYGLLVSRNGGHSFSVVTSRRRRPFERTVRLRGSRVNVVVATACDGNGNCGVRRLGRYRVR